jgi:hypothetical protein
MGGAALLSYGASRIVGPYGLTSWSGMLELLGASAPRGALTAVTGHR